MFEGVPALDTERLLPFVFHRPIPDDIGSDIVMDVWAAPKNPLATNPFEAYIAACNFGFESKHCGTINIFVRTEDLLQEASNH